MADLKPFDGELDAPTSLKPFDGKLDGEASKPSGALRKGVADKALGFASGAVGATKALADVAGAGNVVSNTLDDVNKGINDYLSPEAKADQQEQSAIMAGASGKGAWEGIKAGAKAFGVAPVQTAVQGLGSIVPIIAGTALTGGAAPAAAVGTGIGVAMGAGTAKGAIFDEVKKRGIDKGLTEAQATAEADKAQSYGGANTDQIALGGALGAADALTGVSAAASRIARGALRKPVIEAATNTAERGVLARAGMGMLGEMPLEAAQGGQEQVAANLAAQRAGYEAGTWDNVASNATLETLASAGPGAAFGALDTKTKQTPPPVVPPAPDAAIDQATGQPISEAEPVATPEAPANGMGYNPDAGQMTQFPDGSQSFASEVPPAEPVKPSEAMGLDPAAGPMSAAAVTAVDAGVTQEIQLADAAAADQAAYEQATQAEAEQAAKVDSIDKPITSGPIAEAAMSDEDKRAILFSNKAVADGGIQYEGTKDGDILNGMGKPYPTRFSAQRRARMEGKDWTIAAVFDGFVARRKDTENGATTTPSGLAQGTDEPASNQPGGSGIAALVEPIDGQRGNVQGDAEPVAGNGPADAVPLPGAGPAAVEKPQNQPQDIEPLAKAATESVATASPEIGTSANLAPAPAAEIPRAEGSQPAQVAATKKEQAKADLDHLFGLDQKRPKALDRISKGTAYFGQPLKAQEFIAKNGLKDTHKAVKTKRGWDVVPKNSQPQESTNGTQAPQAVQATQEGQKAPAASTKPVTERQARIESTLSSGGKVVGGTLRTNNGMSLMALTEAELAVIPDIKKDTSEAISARADAVYGNKPVTPQLPPAAPVSSVRATDAPELSASTRARNLLMQLQAKQDAEGMIGDDRLETQINQVKREIAKLDAAEGQNDELDAETRSYEAKANPTYSGEPAKPAAKPDALSDKEKAAKAKMFNALGKLAALAGKNTRMNWTPEEEQQLLPIVIELFDGAMEMGSVTFQKAVRYVREFISSNLDKETADAIPFETLQGAYIHTARKFKDQGATTGKEVMGFDSLAELEKFEDQADTTQTTKQTLAASLFDAIQSGNMPKDNPALKKLVEAFDGKPADPARMKAAQEQLETAIVMTARAVVAKNEGDKTTFGVLERLYNSQPNLNIRTSTSIANQAYSTPAPLAFVASRLAGINSKSTVLEPTAGNGMLLIGANVDNTSTNEINDERIASLKSQGFTPSQNDATEGFDALDSQDAIVTNPPFGSVKDASGKPIKVKVDGYDIGQIDHLIAARALAKMKDDGQATLIIGANKVAGGLSTDDRIFFNWLYGHYNVVGHFEVDGDLYTRQGAAWPVRVIAINGRSKSNTFSPLAGTIKRVNNWSDVYEQYQNILAASRQPVRAASSGPVRAGGSKTGAGSLPVAAGAKTPATDRPVAAGGPDGAGNVTGAGAGVVPNSTKPTSGTVVAGADEQRLNAQPDGSRGLEPAGSASAGAAGRKSAKPAGATALGKPDTGNEFQAPYIPRSFRKDEGVLIPTNMAQPTQDALSALEDEVGDIDEFARKELGYKSTDDLHTALMGLQVDSVATAIYQIKKDKAVVIADQTGIGKGRQAAAIIRWTVKQGYTPVFISVKPSLFTDMYGDLADIGTDDVQPFVLNGDAWVAGADGGKLFANKPATHKRRMEAIEASGQLPDGSNAVFMTYSQINKDNLQRRMLMSLAPNAVFILDESHNAAGASSTGEFVIGALELAKGVTYLSATYAKRPDNMPLYFKTDIGNAAADTDGLAQAMAAGGLPLQTVVSNNLVKAGQMFRRERSYDGVQISSVFDTKNRDLHEQLSNEATKALRALVSADKSFHSVYVKTLGQALAAQGESVQDSAGNQAAAGVQHTEFSSVVHNFVKQMLLGLKAQSAADEAIASLKRGEKPIIAVESTMGSFLNEYATSNNIAQGEELGAFDYRTVLSRALERSRVIIIKDAQGNETKRKVPLSELDVITTRAYQSAQAVIDGLKLSIPVSPIDWMRSQIIKAGYSVAEITGRNLSVDYSDPKKPILSAIDQLEQSDKVNTTRQFNSGKLDALILNVAGSTGISLHASEKFSDQRQRHMIVAQAAGDINIFMQMLGRIHRTGQVALPKYTILSVDLPTEKRPTAVLSIKMKSLNANTSSNTESATSVKTSDILNKYGDQIVSQYLVDNYALAVALDVQDLIGGEDAQDDIARKVTGRLALQPIEVQHAFYDEVEGQYNALIEYLNKTNQNDLEPRTFDFDAKETRQEVLFEGPDKSTPFGEDAIYGEYSIKAQGIAMKPEEIKEAMLENLDGKRAADHANGLVNDLLTTWTAQVNASRAKNGLASGAFDAEKYGSFMAGLYGKDAAATWVALAEKQIASGKEVQDITADAMAKTQGTSEGMEFMRGHAIGKTFRIDINSEPYNAVITNIRSTHKTTGSPFSLSKVQLTVSVNGALRSLTIPGTQFKKIVVSEIQGGYSIEQLFKEQPANQRETAKIVTGNLLAAYGEIEGARGTIISFTKQDGTTEQGILLPKLFDYSKNTRGDFRLPDGAAALRFLQQSENKDIGRFGITSRDGNVRVLPAGQGVRVQVPKSKAKGGKFFLDQALIEAGGDFVSSGNYMVSIVYDRDPAEAMLDLLMKKQALYALPSMAEEAKAMGDGAVFSASNSAPEKQLPLEQIERLVKSALRGVSNAPVVRVVANPEAIGLRAPVDTVPSGVTLTSGDIYVFQSGIGSALEVDMVVFHELFHKGLQNVLPKADYVALMQEIAKTDAKVRQYSSDWSASNAGKAALTKLAEEYSGKELADQYEALSIEEGLAKIAEDLKAKRQMGTKDIRVKRLVAWLAKISDKMGMTRLADKLRSMSYTDAEKFVVDTISKSGGRGPGGGGKLSSKDDIRFRSLDATLSTAANSVRDVKLPAGYLVSDLINGAPGKLGWWHKTVGTQYNLAQRSKPFKRVYDAVQTFMNDVSHFATEAADLAPNILPKLETWRDIGKSPLSADDTKALSAPVFEGTLNWARDESGQAVKMEVLEAAAAKLTPDQKAQRLLRNNHLSQQVLTMWKGMPLDQYESMVNAKYERDMLKAGIVFTSAELKQLFNLTDPQISLYREFRAATDKSLSSLAIADMLRFGGNDVAPIRDAVQGAKTVSEAAETLRDYLLSLAEADPERNDVLTDTANKMIEKGDKAQGLIERGYAPLSRFGHYTLDVVDENGERVYFSLFESKMEAAKMRRKMEGLYPGAQITQGTVSEEAYKMFAGVSPETLELFGDMLGLEAQGDSASAQAFQEYLKLAKSNRSAMKRLIQRQGIAGFSEDAGRVLAGFVYSNARQAASSLHMGEMTAAANEVPKTQGELKDAAVKLVDYIKNPQEEAQALRSVLFAQYIGGSVASAMVNMTQPLTMTFPWLSQYGGVTKAAKQMTAAVVDSNKRKTGDAKLDAALLKAEEDGTVSPQEVHQLMQQSMGKATLRSGDGTRAGDALATAQNSLSRVSLAWGKLFGAAEQFNRRVTFIAAYRTAIAEGMSDPEAFARKAIMETQGVYNKGNKPQWARGAIGSTLFTFKQYSISYVEMLTRMAKNGPEGKKAALLALGVLFLTAGAGGLPGADDLDDIISGAMQAMGYNFDSKQKRQEFFVSLFGEGGAQFMERGISGLPGVPVDLSGRMGLGNLIPATGLFTKKPDHSRDLAEIAGPAGDLIKRAYDATGKLLTGDIGGKNGAIATIAPKAAQNWYQAFDMANMGMYRDAKGMKVLDTDASDAMVKALGFQPTDVALRQDASFDVQRMIGVNRMRETEIANAWALGIFEKDSEKVQAARENLREWNETNPESPIRINFRQIQQRVKNMNQTKAERIARTAPKEIRADVRRELDLQ